LFRRSKRKIFTKRVLCKSLVAISIGFSKLSSVPARSTSNYTTTAPFHTYWTTDNSGDGEYPDSSNFHTHDCCLVSSNAVHISAAPYIPHISDGYVTDRSPRFVLTPDVCPVSIHRKGEAGPPPLAVTEARTCQPSEGKPSFNAFPRLPLDSTPITV